MGLLLFIFRDFTLSNYTIAGVKKPATLSVTTKSEGNGYRFERSHAFKLTDFNRDPTAALMGTLKTGDAMSIHLNVVFNPKQ